MGRQKLCSNGVAGPRQHSHHAMQVDEDVSHPFQDHLLLHDGLGTEAQGGGPLPGTPPPTHTHTYGLSSGTSSPISKPHFISWEDGLILPFPMGCGMLALEHLLFSLHSV